MKTLLSSLIIISSLLLMSCGNANSQSGVKDLSPTAFQQAVQKNGDALLLDVRTPEEYADGHINGFKNIDYYGDNFEQQLAQLDKEKTVYVYCRTGGRSGKTASMLKEMGFKNVNNLDGGIEAWTDDKLPVQK